MVCGVFVLSGVFSLARVLYGVFRLALPEALERSVEPSGKPRMLAYSPTVSLDGRLRRLSVFIRSVLCGEQDIVSSLPYPGDIPFPFPSLLRSFPFLFRPILFGRSIPQIPIRRTRTPLCQFPCITVRHPSFPSVMSALSEMSDSGRRDPRK